MPILRNLGDSEYLGLATSNIIGFAFGWFGAVIVEPRGSESRFLRFSVWETRVLFEEPRIVVIAFFIFWAFS